ncbi:MAG: amidohydrolase [Alicyclobacillus sp.]|nr:amidohydrolase [Alicyclobacillus sp.]
MALSGPELDQAVAGVAEQVVQWRRFLHQHPELSFQEVETARFVREQLQSMPGFELSQPTPTSVVARLRGGRPGPVLALRADMDALPVQEENEVPYASQNPGVMHACGHDGHTAMLLGTARVLADWRPRLAGEIRLLFQHAEELFPGGAEELVRAGVLDGADVVVGAHLWASAEAGQVLLRPGPLMAAPDVFTITIRGRGGHAGQPHWTVDPIAIGAQVVVNLQHAVARNTDPLSAVVVSVTQFHSGTADNVIPDVAELCGTVRTLDPQQRERMPALLERLVSGVAEAHGATYTFHYQHGYRPVVNHPHWTERVRTSLVKAFGPERVVEAEPTMAGEDFSAYQQVVPGVFFFIGAGHRAQGVVYPHHHPRFALDESALAIGVRAFLQIVADVNGLA